METIDQDIVKRSARILIVDDEEQAVRLIERMLLQEGYVNLYSTTDPQKAPGLYHEVKPDLLILDLHMPHWSGFVVLEELRRAMRAEQYLPVLMLTGDLSLEAKHQALVLGVNDFLTKPIDLLEARYRIWNLLHTRFVYRELRKHTDAGDGNQDGSHQ